MQIYSLLIIGLIDNYTFVVVLTQNKWFRPANSLRSTSLLVEIHNTIFNHHLSPWRKFPSPLGEKLRFPLHAFTLFCKKKVFKETHFFHYFGVIRFFLLLPRKRTKQLFSWKLEEAVIKKEARKISVVLIEAKLCENGYLRGRRTEVQLKMAGLPTISSFIVQEFEGGRGNNLINVLQLVTFWKIEKGLVKSLWKRRFKSKCVFSFHFYFIFYISTLYFY